MAPRVLVVDDNPELLTLLSSAFEEAGYEVQTAARGRTAVDLVRRERPDVAVIDVLLPDLMGFEVAEAFRRMRVPFIFMSGVHKGGKAASNAVERYGALGYFEKPFERAALLAAVSKIVPPPELAPANDAPAFDVEAGEQVAEAAEEMQLTGRIELKGQEPKSAPPVTLRSMDREEAQRLRQKRVPLPPPVLAPRIRASTLSTLPPTPASEIPALQPFVMREGVARGELQDNLPQLFAAFYAAQETGELGLQRGQVKKIVYFEAGMPVFALSNLVADRLGQFLVRAGKIDEETLRSAAEEAQSTQQRTGDVLILMGAIGADERMYYVGQQIKSILYSLFAWEDGAYTLSFQARARREAIKLDIHPANLIMRGVKKLYKPERLARLMPLDAKPVPSPEPLFNLSDVELQAWEAHLLTRCDGARTAADLIAISQRPAHEVLGMLVGLASLRILDLR